MAKRQADHGKGADAHAAKDPLASVGAAILRRQLAEMRAREPGTRLGEDIEALHRMRVATQRLRAALRIFVPDGLREALGPIQTGAREISDALGGVRDLDVLRQELRARAEAIPADALPIEALLSALEAVRIERRAGLSAVLEGPAARDFWDAFPGAVDALEKAADPRVTVGKAAAALIQRRFEKVMRSSERGPVLTSSELHQVRIQCKRLRYVCEFFEPWLGRRARSIAEIATKVQDTLGTLHEGDVTPDSLRSLVKAALAGGMPGPANGFGLTEATLALLQERQQERDELLVRFRDQLAKLRASNLRLD